MQVILDTHICLWCLADDPKLSQKARDLIQNANLVFVSSASLWEIANKHALGKLSVSADFVKKAMEQSGATFLPVMPEHCLALATLPPIHSDPFDRMLIAQAITEPLHLITHDEKLQGYPASIYWV